MRMDFAEEGNMVVVKVFRSVTQIVLHITANGLHPNSSRKNMAINILMTDRYGFILMKKWCLLKTMIGYVCH